jgi:hypothetical protein
MKRLAIVIALTLAGSGAYAQSSSTDSSGTDSTSPESQQHRAADSGSGSASPGPADESAAAPDLSSRLGGTGSSGSEDNTSNSPPTYDVDHDRVLSGHGGGDDYWHRSGE